MINLQSKDVLQKLHRLAESPAARPVAAIASVLIIALGFLVFHHTPPTPNKRILTSGGVASSQSQSSTSAIWDSSTHGIIALEGEQPAPANSNDYGDNNYVSADLVLLNPTTGKVIAKQALPSPDRQTKDGTQFSLVYSGSLCPVGSSCSSPDGVEIYDFNATYQYVAIQYDQASDGSNDVGYYDLASGNAAGISPQSGNAFNAQPVDDKSPLFDTNYTDVLDYCQLTSNDSCTATNGQEMAYNIATGERWAVSSVEPDGVNICRIFTSSCGLTNHGLAPAPFQDVSWVADETRSVLGFDDGGNNESIYAANNTNAPLSCVPLQWLDTQHILCDADNKNSNNFLDINVGGMTKISDPNFTSATAYTVPTPVSILPNNSRTNGNPIASPDGKTVAFISCQSSNCGLYSISSTGGEQPKRVMTLGNYNSQNLILLGWK